MAMSMTSVIIPSGQRGKKYNEWQADKNGTSSKPQIRKGINFCIKSASTYEEFLLLMRAKSYEIKGETFEEGAAKYISFRPLDKDRFVRGSTKSLGKEYTKERIEMKRERKAVIPKKDYSARKLIDTSDEKFQNSPGLQRWAAIENLKIASQSYNEAGFLSELEHKIAVKTEARKSAKQSVVELEQVGINLKGLNVDKLKVELEELTKQKNELTSTYNNCEKEVRDLKRKQENLNQYLGRTTPPDAA